MVADADAEAGLGHLARSTALAVALEELGHRVRRLGLGADSGAEIDGVTWEGAADVPPVADEPAAVVVVDSYRLAPRAREQAAVGRRLVEFVDTAEPSRCASLVVGGPLAPERGPGLVGGFAHACLRRPFWDVVPRTVAAEVRSVLVTTGAGNPGGHATAVAGAVREAVPPRAAVGLVHGPQSGDLPEIPGVEALPAAPSLLDHLLAADLVVCAAGQTAIEAAATGTPCVAVVVADNQRGQAEALGDAGAARVVDGPYPVELAAAVRELCDDETARRQLAACARKVVDGQGARRVAAAVGALTAAPAA